MNPMTYLLILCAFAQTGVYTRSIQPTGRDVYSDVADRVNNIYNSVITTENCLARIACELGGLASNIGLKVSPMAKIQDLFIHAKYKPYYKQIRSGQNCERIKCGSLHF